MKVASRQPTDEIENPSRRRLNTSSGARAISRAASVLRAVAMRGETGCSLAVIAERAGLSKSTTHRILNALVEERLVERGPYSRDYRAGPDIFNFAVSAGRNLDIRVIASPVLHALRDATGCTVILAVRCGTDALCVERLLGAHAESASFDVGERVPLGVGASTIAILAFLAEAERNRILDANAAQFGGRRQLARSAIERAIRAARTHRIAVGEYEGLDTRGVSVPVLDHRGQPLASVTISSSLLRAEDIVGAGDRLWAASRSISDRLADAGRRKVFHAEPWRHVN